MVTGLNSDGYTLKASDHIRNHIAVSIAVKEHYVPVN